LLSEVLMGDVLVHLGKAVNDIAGLSDLPDVGLAKP
jgi:hypothetical protein